MPVFFFDCFDGRRHVPDDYGIDLMTQDEARDQAIAIAQSLLCEAEPNEVPEAVSVTVRTQDGATLYAARCSFDERWSEGAFPAKPSPDDAWDRSGGQ